MATDNVGGMTDRAATVLAMHFESEHAIAKTHLGEIGTEGFHDHVHALITERDKLQAAQHTMLAIREAIMGDAEGSLFAAVKGVIAERDALWQEVGRARGTAQFWKDNHLAGNAEIDRLAARCTSLEETNEGLERRLQFVREMQRHHLFNATSLHIAMYGWAQKYDAAQAAHGCAEERSEPKASGRSEATGDGSPPASDATDNTDGETK